MEKDNQRKSEHIIVICSYCKKCLQGQDLWDHDFENAPEVTKAKVSHGICPGCLQENFPNEYLIIQEEKKVRINKIFENSYKSFYGHVAK